MRWITTLGVVATIGSALASERMEGEVALSTPSCGTFVVSTGRGYSLLHQREYYPVFKGDLVRGPLQELGTRELEIFGEMTIAVTVEQSALTFEAAAAIHRQRCEVVHG